MVDMQLAFWKYFLVVLKILGFAKCSLNIGCMLKETKQWNQFIKFRESSVKLFIHIYKC